MGKILKNSDVAAYIDNRIKDSVPGLKSQGDVVRFDPIRDRYVGQGEELVAMDPSVFGNEHLESKRIFLQAMKEYEEKAKPEYKSHLRLKEIWPKFANTSAKPGGALKLEGKTTWVDVLTQVTEAENAYLSRAKTKNVAGNVTKYLRKFSGSAKDFQSWLDVLPQGDYSSIICGGFKMIFVAAAKISEVREEIFDFLGSIPYHVSRGANYSTVFRDLPPENKAELGRRIASLYVGVLEGLNRVLRWFTKRAGFFIALLKGDEYESKFIDNKAQIKKLADEVKDYASDCSYIRQRRMEEKQRIMDEREVRMEKGIAKSADQAKERDDLWHMRQDNMEKNIQTFREETASADRQTNEGVFWIKDKMQEMEQELKQEIKSQRGPENNTHITLNFINNVYYFFQGHPLLESQQIVQQDMQVHASGFPQGQEAQFQLDATPYMPLPGKVPTELIPLSVNNMLHEKKVMSKTSLLHHLSHSATELSSDLETCLAFGPRLDFEEQDRVAYITRHHKIKHLLSSDTSECLLVNGNAGVTATISSVSFFSAIVAQFIKKLDMPGKIDMPVAYFFCGLHSYDFYPGPLTGPVGMLRQLTSQIVSYCKEEWIEDVEAEDADDIDGLFRLLAKMMAMQPYNQAVFFIVDAISLYYTQEWMADTARVVNGLMELAESSRGIIKVLFTSPTIAVEVQQLLDEDHVLRAPREMVNGQRMGFGLRQASETLG